MDNYAERELALRLFAPLLDTNLDFAYALKNYNCANIIRVAPEEAYDILSKAEQGVVPAKWAYYLVYFNQKRAGDWVWPIITTSPMYSYLLILYYPKRIPADKRNMVLDAIAKSPEYTYRTVHDLQETVPADILDKFWRTIIKSAKYSRFSVRDFQSIIPETYQDAMWRTIATSQEESSFLIRCSPERIPARYRAAIEAAAAQF